MYCNGFSNTNTGEMTVMSLVIVITVPKTKKSERNFSFLLVFAWAFF